MAELVDKVAIVTGGSRGLGRAISEAFANEGAKVIAASRSGVFGQPSEPFENGGLISSALVDVTDADSVRELMKRTVSTWGGLDIVVANAGVSHDGKMLNLTDEQWQATMETNLMGTFRTVQAAAAHMQTLGGGRIITMSSIMGTRAVRGASAYAASKAAIEMFSRCAALELGRDNIYVNCIAPGVLDEGLGADLAKNERVFGEYVKRTALGRVGAVSEVAEFAVYLAGSKSGFVNGEVYPVNGGWA